MIYSNNILEKILISRIVDVSTYIKLREIFLGVYENTAELDPVKEYYSQFKKDDIREKAKAAAERSKDFDPHSVVFDPVSKFNQIFRAVYGATILAAGILYFVIDFSIDHLSFLITIPGIWEVLLNLGIPLGWIFGVIFYLELLRRDRTFIRLMNRKLIITEDKIDAEDDEEVLISYLLWNRSLSSNTTLPILGFIGVLSAANEDLLENGLRFANYTLMFNMNKDMNLFEALGASYEIVFQEYMEEK